MDNNYADRRAYGDACLSTAKTILAKCFFTSVKEILTAPDDIDRTEATDLIVSATANTPARRIALRSRSSHYQGSYPNDITMRLSRDRNGKHEWDKVRAGLVDYMLYCFSEGEKITAWKLIDLKELVSTLFWDWDTARKVCRKHEPQGQEPFMSVDLSGFCGVARDAIVIASGDDY